MPSQPEGLCGRGRWGLCLAEEETQSSVTVCPRYTTVTQQRHQRRLSPAEPSLVPPDPSRRLQMLCRGACGAPEPPGNVESCSHHAARTAAWELPAPGVLRNARARGGFTELITQPAVSSAQLLLCILQRHLDSQLND